MAIFSLPPCLPSPFFEALSLCRPPNACFCRCFPPAVSLCLRQRSISSSDWSPPRMKTLPLAPAGGEMDVDEQPCGNRNLRLRITIPIGMAQPASRPAVLSNRRTLARRQCHRRQQSVPRPSDPRRRRQSGPRGLRVVEDYVRFALDDRHLTEQLSGCGTNWPTPCGGCRPGHAGAARPRPTWERTVTTPSESRRADAAGVARGRFLRLEESLRTRGRVRQADRRRNGRRG